MSMETDDEQAINYKDADLGQMRQRKLAYLHTTSQPEPPPKQWSDEGLTFDEAMQVYERTVLDGLKRDFHRIRMLLHHTKLSEEGQAYVLKTLIQLSEEVR